MARAHFVPNHIGFQPPFTLLFHTAARSHREYGCGEYLQTIYHNSLRWNRFQLSRDILKNCGFDHLQDSDFAYRLQFG